VGNIHRSRDKHTSILSLFLQSGRFLWCIPLASFLTLFSACEKENGTLIDQNFATPYLSPVTLSEGTLDISKDTTGSVQQLDSIRYKITILFRGTVIGVGGDVPSQGMVQVFKPDTVSPFLQNSFGLSPASGDTFSFASPLSFTIRNTDVGTMHLVFSVTSMSGLVSNVVQQSLSINRAVNHIPTIGTISLPDTIVLPPNDSVLIKITAAISDADGLGDIQKVFFYSLNSSDSTQKIIMYDDGGLNSTPPSGDDVAGDGTYTVTVKLVDSPFVRSVGTFHFEFHAIDKENASATPVIRSITIR